MKLRRAGMRLGLGGIAKGYAVDRCAGVLRGEGLRRLHGAGGRRSVRRGQQGAAPTGRSGMRDPRGGARHHRAHADPGPRVLDRRRLRARRSSSTASATTTSSIPDRLSGDGVAQVTIFAPTALLADALDDAVFILGPKKGLALVDSMPDCSTVIVDAQEPGVDVEVAGGEAAADRRARRTGSEADDRVETTRRRRHRRRHHGLRGGAAAGAARGRRDRRRARHPRRRGVERRGRHPGAADGGRRAGAVAGPRA